MDLKIVYIDSAFKHGVTQEDIEWAIKTKEYDAEIEEEGYENKHLIIGFDCNTNIIEIFYNVLDEDTIRVFHAMKCRKKFIKLLTGGQDG
jgi:uncharacterized DUF497 family protein